MRIALDARWVFPAISGIGSYTVEILRHLAAADRDNSYMVLFDDAARAAGVARQTGMDSAPNFSARVVPAGVFSLRGQVLLPLLLRRERIEVYHSPNYMIPFLAFPRRRSGRTRCVVTLHDVIPLLFPGHAPRARKSRLFPLYRRLMAETAARADAIIAVSDRSRLDIIGQLRLRPPEAARVRTVHNGVDRRFRPAPPADRGSDGDAGKFSAGRPARLLCVGRADPYKNLAGLVRAMAAARDIVPVPLRLTVIGQKDDRYPEAPRLAAELGLGDVVRWVGHVTDGELLAAYREADLLVHPSTYEGFGLPVLEAMACGVPVVCGNAGALPEVAGDAALLVDPADPRALAEAIRRVLTDRGLARDLAARGLRRAAAFTWERAARETLEVYRAALEGGRQGVGGPGG